MFQSHFIYRQYNKYILEYLLEYIPNNMKRLIDKGTRKLIKIGKTSLAVTLPIELLKDLGWKEKQKVTATRVHGGIMIKDWKK